MKIEHDNVLSALRRIMRATDLHSKYLSKTTGLTAPQLLIMQLIQKQGETTSSVLAKEVSLSQATVTTILDRLESRALVQRVRSETDKRQVRLTLTEAGQKLIVEAPAPLQHQFIKIYDALPDWEQTTILASLQRIAQMMDAENLDASPVLDIGALDRNGGDH
jgi:DNA-binding MarR family transcriptional regulator